MDRVYDLAILGAGPAGLAAALYAGRARLDTLLIEKGQDGGQISITGSIENYPGGLPEESGPSLAARMSAQAEHFGVCRAADTIRRVKFGGEVKALHGGDGRVYRARAVIIATGASPRPLGCARERELVGKGVSYCATCDANLFEGYEVYVVGGGDAAVEEACYLSRFARRVTVIHRRETLRAAPAIRERAFANPRIRFLWNSVVHELHGDELLSGITVRSLKTGALTRCDAAPEDGFIGLFPFIGFEPNSALFAGSLEMENGYLPTDGEMRTGVPGVFAAGDIRVKGLRQVVTACADGAVAAMAASRYLEELG